MISQKSVLKRKDKTNAKLTKELSNAYEKGYFNGCVCVACGDTIICKGAYGFANIDTGRMLTVDTAFNLESVTKQFTATAIMILRDKGLLSVDDDIIKFFPNIPYQGIKIRNLLTHTSGITDKILGALIDTGKPATNKDTITLLLSGKYNLDFLPGQKESYSNAGYEILAEIIEIVSGMSYDEFLKTELFVPSGMSRTAIVHRIALEAESQDLAYPYFYENDEFTLPENSVGDYFRIVEDGMNGDTNCFSTVLDMVKWSNTLHDGKLISLPSQDEMYCKTMLSNGKKTGYGFGWEIHKSLRLGKYIHHSGGGTGYCSDFYRLLNQDTTIVIVRNIECEDECYWQLIDNIFNIVVGKSCLCKTPHTVNERTVKKHNLSGYNKYVGIYEACGELDSVLSSNECVIIEANDKHLYIKNYSHTVCHELFPVGKNRFTTLRFDKVFQLDGKTIRYQKDKPLKRID